MRYVCKRMPRGGARIITNFHGKSGVFLWAGDGGRSCIKDLYSLYVRGPFSLPVLEHGALVFDTAEKIVDMLETIGPEAVLDEERFL